jgi:hypothetical protein
MNYDPKKITLVVGGAVVTGYSPDSMVKCARRTEKNSLTIGCQGEGVFAESADDSAEVTISLVHTSPTNSILHALYLAKAEFPFAVVDANAGGGDLGAAGSRCKIKNLRDFDRGKEIGNVEWVLLVVDYEAAFKIPTE